MFVMLLTPTLMFSPPTPSLDGPQNAQEWQLQVAPGGEFFVFGDRVIGNGPSFKIGAFPTRYFGHFMIGGGPALHYSSLFEKNPGRDVIHQITLNGEMMIGGGTYEKFGVYGHLVVGGGAAHAYDGATDQSFWLPWFRAAGGIGAYGYLTPRISLGALVDIGFPGIVDAMVTLGFHVGKKTR